MDFSNVSVFKTNVKSKKAVRELDKVFASLPKLSAWNFDLEDCDHILRTESSSNISEEIIDILQKQNFTCEELF
jgi:hypothetical protein